MMVQLLASVQPRGRHETVGGTTVWGFMSGFKQVAVQGVTGEIRAVASWRADNFFFYSDTVN